MCFGKAFIELKALFLTDEFVLPNTLLLSKERIRSLQKNSREFGDKGTCGKNILYLSDLRHSRIWFRPISLPGFLASNKGSYLHKAHLRI